MSQWQEDPRLQSLDPEKLQFLTQFLEQLEHTPRSQLLSRFLSLNAEAARRNIAFSDSETDALTQILTGYMSPADRGKIGMLRTLARKLSARRG